MISFAGLKVISKFNPQAVLRIRDSEFNAVLTPGFGSWIEKSGSGINKSDHISGS
jgi:hypothetical protein